jgi:hypothetical protein
MCRNHLLLTFVEGCCVPALQLCTVTFRLTRKGLYVDTNLRLAMTQRQVWASTVTALA